MKEFLAALLLAMLCFGCSNNQPEHPQEARKEPSVSESEKVGKNPGAEAFAKSLVGNWKAVFTRPGNTVQSAEFRADGTVTLLISKQLSQKVIMGKYKVQPEPNPDSTTNAFFTIVVESTSGRLVLSRVFFGDHKGVSGQDAKHSPFLRIDKEPYGVLKRVIQEDAFTPSVVSPSAFVKATPEFITNDGWKYTFSKTGTFKSYDARASAFSYRFDGKWTVLKNGTIKLQGTRWNGYAKTSTPAVGIVEKIIVIQNGTLPVVQLETVAKFDPETLTMPTKPSMTK